VSERKKKAYLVEITDFSFGSIRIDGKAYDYDVIIDGGRIHKRVKKPSKRFKDQYGHTPLSADEDIPWDCRYLVIGTGAYGPRHKLLKRCARIRRITTRSFT